jgi:hypothetical protein
VGPLYSSLCECWTACLNLLAKDSIVSVTVVRHDVEENDRMPCLSVDAIGRTSILGNVLLSIEYYLLCTKIPTLYMMAIA